MTIVEIIMFIIFGVSAFVAFHAMVGYPLFLKLIDIIFKPKKIKKDLSYKPTVTILIPAHNEEAVIQKKIENCFSLDYPKDKLEVLVTSDHSTDNTNKIVEDYIKEHPDRNVRLHITEKRMGKTNAQNEAQKTVKSEILFMTDANSYLAENSIREIVCCFTSPKIVYVAGRQSYTNSGDNRTSNSDGTYLKLDLYMRDVESRLQTITAANGAIYAVRNSEYYDFKPIACHDEAMPFYYARKKKKALYNPDAIAYEKAGESMRDEFKRKVRMNRSILSNFWNWIRTWNIFKYKWFTVFFFGHRFCRYSLWWAHLLALASTIVLCCYGNIVGIVLTSVQVFAILVAIISIATQPKNLLLRMIGYYCMTLFAQYVGVFNILTGRAKPFWKSVDSTR